MFAHRDRRGSKETRVIQFKAVGVGASQTIAMYGLAAPAMVGTQSTWVVRRSRRVGTDFFKDFNVLSFVIELRRSLLAGPHRRYDQVQRLGRPAGKEAFEMSGDHDATNRTAPWSDTLLSNSIRTFTTRNAAGGVGRSMQTAQALQHILIPDELAADLSSTGPAGYLGVETKAKNFSGRGLATPVMTPSLSAIFGDTIAKLGLAPDDQAESPSLTSENVKPTDRGVSDACPYFGSPV